MIRATMMVVIAAIVASGSPAAADTWQPLHETDGGVVYAFSPASIIRTDQRVEVQLRSIEAMASGKELVTTVRYNLDCRQRTFRILEVVEEKEGERNICRTASDDIPLRPQKHVHLEKLRTTVCP